MQKGRTFVIGDIHGAHRALLQCLERSRFDRETDQLICLGDVADGWPETRQCVDELMTVKNLVYLLGNHDWWTLEWMQTGLADAAWREQGGEATLQSYDYRPNEPHLRFFRQARSYYIQENRLFVHAGISLRQPVAEQGLDIFLWDRTMVRMAQDFHDKGLTPNLTGFDEVYVGHTPVAHHPRQYCEVWMMDTGAGWTGVLSMMNVYTKDRFVSDPVPALYPGVEGRKKS